MKPRRRLRTLPHAALAAPAPRPVPTSSPSPAAARRVLRETGRLLGAFTWGALATVVGSLLAFWLLPLRGLGADGWKVAAALTARHIGGSVNYVAVSEALSLSPSARMAGLAADDLIVSAYFLTLYALARGVPPEAPSTASFDERADVAPAPPAGAWAGTLQTVPAVEAAGTLAAAAATVSSGDAVQQQQQQRGRAGQGGADPPAAEAAATAAATGAAAAAGAAAGAAAEDSSGGFDIDASRTITVLHGATALALAAAICFAGTSIAAALRYKGGSITVITAITVTLATLFPRLLAPLRASGEGLAAILMQLFFASVGASGSIATVMQTAPSLFLWSAVAVSTHLGLVLLGERLFGFTRKESCLASNANIGGPTTAAGMAAAKGWRGSLVPALLIGIMGYATATFVGVACASVFRAMQVP